MDRHVGHGAGTWGAHWNRSGEREKEWGLTTSVFLGTQKNPPWEKKEKKRKKNKSSHPYDLFVSRHGLTHALGAKITHGHKGAFAWEQTAHVRTHARSQCILNQQLIRKEEWQSYKNSDG